VKVNNSPDKVAPDKVAIYIRWSTEDQGLGHTLEIQRESSRYYALSQGWSVRDDLTFIDDGHSGGSLERPALTRLRRQVRAGRVDCVVVYKLDRLSRNIKDIINLVLDEWDGICCVRSTQEPVDTTTDAGKMFFTMLGSFADFERATIKTRTWSGKLKNAEQGRNPGFPYPFGFRKGETGGYEVVEAEAAVVRQIFDLYLRGQSCHGIARMFNEQGIATRGGRGWADAYVSAILRNPIYFGRLVFNRQAHARGRKLGKVILNDANQVITVDGAAPAIVDPQTWEQVRRIAAQRPRVDRTGSPRTRSSAFLLTGLARCTCGHSIVGYYGGKGYKPYYYCAGAQKKGPAICVAGMVQARALERFVVERVRATWPLRGAFRADMLAGLNDRLRQHDAAGAALQARLDALSRHLERFKHDYQAGKLAADLYSELTAEARRERDELVARLRSAGALRQELAAARVDLDQLETWYGKLNDWETLETAEQKQVLQMLIAQVSVFRKRRTDDVHLHIDWRLPKPVR
jgi:site-specific DNA recombinase